jgi:hypothetical protein
LQYNKAGNVFNVDMVMPPLAKFVTLSKNNLKQMDFRNIITMMKRLVQSLLTLQRGVDK